MLSVESLRVGGGLAHERVHAGEVLQAALHARHGLEGGLRDAGRCAGLGTREDRAGLGGHRHGFLDGLELQREVDRRLFAEVDHDPVTRLRTEAGDQHADLVGTADAHVEHAEPAVTLGDCRVLRSRGLVHGGNAHPGQHAALVVDDAATEVAGGDTLGKGGVARREHPDGTGEHDDKLAKHTDGVDEHGALQGGDEAGRRPSRGRASARATIED